MKKSLKPIDMASVKTYPLQNRINKVSVQDFATLPESETDLSPFLASLPNILKGQIFWHSLTTSLLHIKTKNLSS